jgi:hypothetical protein
MLSISSSDLTSVPQSRRRARASGGGDQTKKLPRNSESSPIDIRALQETRSTASHRSSAEPTGEMTGVTLSGSTVASNQVFESSGGRALIPNAKGRREPQVSLDGSADPLVKDRQSDTKIDIVTTPVPTVAQRPSPRQRPQRRWLARRLFGGLICWRRRPPVCFRLPDCCLRVPFVRQAREPGTGRPATPPEQGSACGRPSRGLELGQAQPEEPAGIEAAW